MSLCEKIVNNFDCVKSVTDLVAQWLHTFALREWRRSQLILSSCYQYYSLTSFLKSFLSSVRSIHFWIAAALSEINHSKHKGLVSRYLFCCRKWSHARVRSGSSYSPEQAGPERWGGPLRGQPRQASCRQRRARQRSGQYRYSCTKYI